MPDILQQWLTDEAVQLERLNQGVGPGVFTPAQVMGMTGLEIMQGICQGELPYPPISQTLQFFLMEIADGRAVFQGAPSDAHLNPLGTIHGGWFATLLDSAVACAIQTRLPPGRSYSTVELSVNLVRALTPKIPRVRAIGHVLHVGKQLATAEGKILGPDGVLYAHATTTCLVFEMQKPAQ
jgi:uncharacterized protein (TIGR00369 family)